MSSCYATTSSLKLLPVIAVLFTNDVSNKDLAVTKVIKAMFLDSIGGEGTAQAKRLRILLVRRDG
jgi:hypothetical protein